MPVVVVEEDMVPLEERVGEAIPLITPVVVEGEDSSLMVETGPITPLLIVPEEEGEEDFLEKGGRLPLVLGEQVAADFSLRGVLVSMVVSPLPLWGMRPVAIIGPP